MKEGGSMLSINNLSKQFNGIEVLNNISLEISSPSIVGLAGSSGSGKSTLLRCIQDLEKCDKGEIICNNTRGFIFQDFQLFPHMNVLENITYSPQKTLHHDNAAAEENAVNLLQQLGLHDKVNSYPNTLSGGQKQRVALARTLAMQPEIVLCDEPTSGLDIGTIRDVVKILKKVHAMGISLIIASHDIEFLTNLADRIIILKNGVVAQDIERGDQNFSMAALKALLS